MSRSNPQEHLSNPAVRWFEWNGEKGVVRYYDKEQKKNIDVPLPFSFILLDRLGCVGGWHELSKSAIYSNEVKDTRQDVLVVKAFKGGTIAEGLYNDIKAVVKAAGGAFTANCYIAFKDGDEMKIGSMKFKGAGLGGWMDFEKAHRAELYDGAITIHDFTEGKKGRVVFRVPKLKVSGITRESNALATELDKTVQRFLSVYLKRNTREQAVVPDDAPPVSDEDIPWQDNPEAVAAITDDDIPF